MFYLYVFTGLVLIVSFILDRGKSIRALKIALKKIVNLLPVFVEMIIIISIVLYLVPENLIATCLGSSRNMNGILIAAFFGSIAILPGFIVFPLSGILLEKGVTYMVLSAFTTTLMMVGVLTFPLEKKFLGTGVAVARNIISLIIALIVAIVTGIFYGEIL